MLITKNEYYILRCLDDNSPIDEEENSAVLQALAKSGYVKATAYKPINYLFEKACDYIITEDGRRAVEEYRRAVTGEIKSTVAIIVSVVAVAVSILSVIISQ